MLAVVFVANLLNYLDRQIASSVEKELRAAFDMDKAEFGYLWTAFTVGYMVFAPLIGYLSDRRDRPKIFSICVLVWSLATIGSGLVTTKAALYSMRFLIGVGEAGCLVVGPTLLADAFPRQARGRVLSLFYLGMPVGGSAGYLVGGIVSQYFGGWQTAFFVAGTPGLLVALGLWFVTDPPREGTGRTEPAGLRDYTGLLRNRTLVLVILAQAFAVVILAPILHFSVGFFEESRGMTKVQATATLGGIALVAGVIGNALSGFVGDRIARRRRGAYALVAGVAYGLAMPAMLIGFSVGQPWVYVPALTLGSMGLFLCMPAVNTQIANVVSSNQRAMAYALAVFILHFLGDMSAPPVFGAVADRVGTDTAFVWFSFALLAASACCLLASRTAERDIARIVEEPPPSR